MSLLDVRELSVRFGGVVALDRVSFTVEAGDIVGLIGPNGAGKTTLFNVITRVYRPSDGSVSVDGSPVLKMAPHEVIRRGVARTFQNLALFRSMTVLDNVLVGDHIRTRSRWLESSVPMPSALNAESASRKRALEMLDFVGLAQRAGRRHQPRGGRRCGSTAAPDPLGTWHHDAPGLAPHGLRDGHLGAGGRARFRQEDRRGQPGR